MKRKDTGALGEKLALDFLIKQGYTIVETNFRTSSGEIDIIARKDDYLVFVEVRAKTSLNFGSPEESITPLKKEHLITVASQYRERHENLPELWRIDLVAVELNHRGQPTRIELIENAVSEF